MDERRLLICHLRPARRRARQVALVELLCLLEDLGAEALPGGPFAERGGVCWIALPAGALDAAAARCPRLGYTVAVDVLEPTTPASRSPPVRVRWRGTDYAVVRLYEEDAAATREHAVDRRSFVLAGPGGVRTVRGYRGSSAPLSRRGLPVADARLLVNLHGPPHGGSLLDPFAGAGGIVVQAREAGWRVLSVDRDAVLRFGLARFADAHILSDVRALPLASGSVQAIATEPPYEPEADDALLRGLHELVRVLRPGGRLALLCAERQALSLRNLSKAIGLQSLLDAPIDRKGVPVHVL